MAIFEAGPIFIAQLYYGNQYDNSKTSATFLVDL